MHTDPKVYLSQIRHIQSNIEARIREKELITQSSELRTTYHVEDKVQGSGGLNRSYDSLISAIDSIDERVGAMIRLKQRISEEIDTLDNLQYQTILRMRYINLETFESIAQTLQYDVRHIHRLHGLALIKFKKDVIECHVQ